MLSLIHLIKYFQMIDEIDEFNLHCLAVLTWPLAVPVRILSDFYDRH